MSPAVRNLVNLKSVGKGYGSRSVLRDITLGVAAGDRIGVVGRNGDGKSTLLRLIAAAEQPDSGLVTRSGAVDIALLGQGDELDSARTIREEVIGTRADHEWAGDGGCTDGAVVHYSAAEYQELIANDAARGGKHIVIKLQWPEGLSHE